MNRLRRQDAFVILPFCLVMAAIMAIIFMYASSRSQGLIDKVSRSQAIFYGNQLSVKFAQRLRWSYDAARADAPPSTLGLCTTTYGGVITPVGAVSLCLINNKICVAHPQLSSQNVCISPANDPVLAAPTLIARRPGHMNRAPSYSTAALLSQILIDTALAQNVYAPADPPAGSTTINFTPGNTRCIGGECRAICGVAPAGNADCITFKFCPLIGTCEAKQYVWQTVAFIR